MYSSKCHPKRECLDSGRRDGSFEVIKVVGKAVYQLRLPAQLFGVHDVLHVSMLRKCQSDETPVVELEDIEIQDGGTYEEQPVKILDTEEKVLYNKVINY